MQLCSVMTVEGCGDYFNIALIWLVFAIIVLVALICKKKAEDGDLFGLDFNFIGCLVAGIGGWLLIATLTASARWAGLAGIIGFALGGFALAFITGGGYE